MEYVKTRRSRVSPNAAFREQLKKYAKQIGIKKDDAVNISDFSDYLNDDTDDNERELDERRRYYM